MKLALQRAARRRGYEIRKSPTHGYKAISVLRLGIEYMLATRKDPLSFVEVGANDGLFDDELHSFIVKHRWKGLLIEPQPDVFARLVENYAPMSDVLSFENVAISNQGEWIEMYRLPAKQNGEGEWEASVASASSKTTAKSLGVSAGSLEKIKVPTAKLDDLVVKHGLEKLDILQLDTEGFDFDVVQTLNLRKTRPKLIRFEHGHMAPQTIEAMAKHLNAMDYDLYYGGYEADSIALCAEFFDK